MVGKKQKVLRNKVDFVFTGKSRVYKVNDKHDVILRVSGTCEYQGIQGIPNGKFCSHILSVFKKILEDEGFEVR